MSVVEISKEASFDDFAGQEIVPDRMSPFFSLARGKRVLDVGFAGSEGLVAEDHEHCRIAAVSSYCVGIDIFEPGVQRFQAAGYNTVLASAEDFNLPEKDFDVALMGDIIEHVSNPGLVFDSVSRHLKEGGRAVVTTPNPFSITLMLRRIFGAAYLNNSEHVTWFDPILLSYLMERSGFGNFEIFWADQSRFAPLRWMQRRSKSLHGTFGLIGTKLRSV